MQQFDIVRGIFNPKRTDDLKEPQFIGQEFEWKAQFIIDGGEYDGQFAMMPLGDNPRMYHWAPECDVDIIEQSGEEGYGMDIRILFITAAFMLLVWIGGWQREVYWTTKGYKTRFGWNGAE